MDFHALPRRDLQALCKRNGVRANMTNAAMADALGALLTVDGVEEYVKQPPAVPEPAVKAAVAEKEEVRREKQGSPLLRGRRVTVKTSEIMKPDEGKGMEEEKEEVRREKQGSPFPRGRRVTVKASEVVKPDEVKGKEKEKAEAKRDSNREEDAPALGVGRRGASRRARPTSVVAVPEAEPAAKAAAEKQGSPPPRARRATVKSPATDRSIDGVQKEDFYREANKEDAPVQGVVRRGPSRRARAVPVADAPAAEPETKAAAAAEEKPPEPVRPDDSVEEEDMKLEANHDAALAKGVGRRGPSRRARPAPIISKPTATAAVEEGLVSPPPRGRRATFSIKSSAPTRIEGGEEGEEDEMQREAVKDIVPAVAVGRRGARGRARTEPAVPAPACDLASEEDAPIPRGRRGKAQQPIRLNGGEEEATEELNLAAKEEEAPAHGVTKQGPSRRARPATLEVPATREKDPVRSTEVPEVTSQAVLVRPTRVRKPTMKAAAVAEEKVTRRTSKKTAPRNSTLQKEHQEEPQEDMPALVSDMARYDLENVEDAAGPQSIEKSEVIDEEREEDEELVMKEDDMLVGEIVAEKPSVADEILMEESLTEELPVIDEECICKSSIGMLECKGTAPRNSTLQEYQGEPQEAMPALVSDEACYDLEELDLEIMEEAADPQNLEQSKVVDGQRHGDEELLINEDDILLGEIPAEKPSVTDEILMEESLTEPPVIDEECMSNSAMKQQEYKERSQVDKQWQEDEELGQISAEKTSVADEILMEESLTGEPPVIDEECMSSSAMKKQECKGRSPVEEHQVDVEPCVSLSPCLEDSPVLGLVSMFAEQTVENDEEEGQLYKGMGEEVEMKPLIQSLQAPVTANEPPAEVGFTVHADHDNEMDSSNSVQGTEDITTVGGEDVADDEAEEHTDTVHEAAIVDCSGKINSAVEEMNEGVISDNVTHVTQTDATSVCTEKAELVAKELPQGSAKLDQNCDEDDLQSFIVHVDKDVEEDGFQSDFVHMDEENLVADAEKSQGTATVDENVEEDFQTEHKEITITTADSVQDINGDNVVEKVLITKELQQSTDKMYEEDVGDDQLESDFVLMEKQNEVASAAEASKLTITDSEGDQEEEDVEITQVAPRSIGTMDECFQLVEIDSVHTGDMEKVFTADNVLKVTETEDEVLTSDLPREDISRNSILALLDDITESLSTITITEPTSPRNEDVPMCMNSSEKKSVDLVCRNKTEKDTNELLHENKTENTAQPVEMQGNIVVRAAKKSADLKELSLGQLRAKLKKTLRKKEKRMALARVDGNVCRSNPAGQEQARNLQQN